ncbi:hypothetical protein N0B51_08930 [Tsuneonella sp. YG55]|uniref:Uncharacterized protein n=1 Tax=Tsuneonella litorea TaxID=2976475 RepID=A0A9X2W2N8_9SPHN|nr:hypothetical protein [Tsuneonella litorea]MCT2559104.1 hypothetical protein [Tsuneonella litorea]
MPLRFAPARTITRSPIARALARRAVERAANDNGDLGPADDAMLYGALRHFATHGLGAALAAATEAERALAAGDRQAHDWWLGICRTFDRRLADRRAEAARLPG